MAKDPERGEAPQATSAEKPVRAILNELRDVLYLLDIPAQSVRYVNPAVEQMLGITPQQFVQLGPRGLWKRVHPEEREQLVAAIREALRSAETASRPLEFRILHRDGQYRWVSASQRVVRGPSGSPLRVIGTLRDVTERKRAETELLREREFFSTIIESTAALIVVLDPEGRIIRFNKACRELTGRELDSVRGQHVWDFVTPPPEREEVRRAFQEALETGGPVKHECHWLGAEGEERLIAWTDTCCRDDAGKTHCVVATGVDVTEQRHVEERLRGAARLEAVGQLAGGIAHDFNNLLTAIIGYCDLTLMEMPDEVSVCDDVLRIKSAAKRAANLSERLLAFSSQQPSQLRVTDVNERIAEIARMLRRVIEENIELQVNKSEAPLKVRMDPAQLERIVVNLAVNARDAMPDGGRLTIATGRARRSSEEEPAENGTGYAVLTVQDTGTGMTPQVRERIFDPFFTTKALGCGTGLGLTTVCTLVQQLGGRVECESAPGEGTVFRVYLPLLGRRTPVTEDETAYGLRLGGDETVLLVEDDEKVREMATRVLEGFGYTVLTAPDGQRGLDTFRRHRATVDLLITDVVMPRMSGPDLVEKARSLRPDVKVLYVSGYTASERPRALRQTTTQPFLAKPFTASRLAQKVREVLAES